MFCAFHSIQPAFNKEKILLWINFADLFVLLSLSNSACIHVDNAEFVILLHVQNQLHTVDSKGKCSWISYYDRWRWTSYFLPMLDICWLKFVHQIFFVIHTLDWFVKLPTKGEKSNQNDLLWLHVYDFMSMSLLFRVHLWIK